MWRGEPSRRVVAGLTRPSLTNRFCATRRQYAPTRDSILSSRSRTTEELNLRLSTCLYNRKASAGLQIFDQARKERLPFDNQSMDYTVYNLVLAGQFRRAENLLEQYRQEERVIPSEKAYRYILIGYARCGDFDNIHKLIKQMRKAEVPVTEHTYEDILQNSEKYFLNKDMQEIKFRKKIVREPSTISHAEPRETYGPSYKEFCETLSHENEILSTNIFTKTGKNKKFAGASGTSDTSPLQGLLNSAKKNSGHIQLPKGLISSKEDFTENPLSGEVAGTFFGASADKSSSQCMKTIAELYKYGSKREQEQNEVLVMEEPELSDLSNFYSSLVGDYRVLIAPQKGGPRMRNKDGGKQCSLTGGTIDVSGKVIVSDLAVPFHTYVNDPSSTSTKYEFINGEKEPITESFSVEEKIERGEGVMLRIDEDILFSLTYHRSNVTGRSMLSIMTEGDGKEAGLFPSAPLFAALIHGYGRGGNLDAVDECVEAMDIVAVVPDATVINRLIEAKARNLAFESVDTLLEQIKKIDNFVLTSDTIKSLTYAFGKQKKHDRVKEFIDLLQAVDCKHPESEPGMLYSQALQKNISEVESGYEGARSRGEETISLYDSIISGFSESENYQGVCDYYKKLEESDIAPSEHLLNLACDAFYKTRNLDGLVKAMWSLKYYGYQPINSKRTSYLVDLLCAENQTAQVIKIFGLHQHLPFVLKPGNFLHLLKNLFANGQKETVINSFDSHFQWPAFVAFVKLFSSKQQNNELLVNTIEREGYRITENILNAAAYHQLKTGQNQKAVDTYFYCKDKLPNVLTTPKLYALTLLAVGRLENIPQFYTVYEGMEKDEISIADLAKAGLSCLSAKNFAELTEHMYRNTKVNMDQQITKEGHKSILDYLKTE